MPTYNEISKEMLEKWLLNLITKFNYLYNYPSSDLLCYLFLKLYEYMQCYAKFYIEGCKDLKGIKVTLRDIRDRVNFQDYNRVINKLYKIRNSVGHGNKQVEKHIISLFQDEEFYDTLFKFDLDEKLFEGIKRVGIVFCDYDSTKNKCKISCTDKVRKARNSDVTVSSILSELYADYPKSFVDDCMLEILSDEYLIH